MSILNISLFGKFQVTCSDREVIGLDSRKAQELFCYLLLYWDRSHTRETLSNLLWSDRSTAQSKKYLRQTLWMLQSALDPHTETDSGRMLSVDSEWVRLNSKTSLELDVALFEQAYALARGVVGHEMDAGQAGALEEAVQLYQGDLLEGWYLDWCLFERERLRNMYLAALDKLIGYCEVQQSYELGLTYGTRILRYDRARERTHRQLMRLHYQAGDRTAALRQYASCVAALAEELGVKPARRTAALYEQIRADRLRGPGPAPVADCAEPDAMLLTDTLGRLRSLQRSLAGLQHQVGLNIRAVEQALNGPPQPS